MVSALPRDEAYLHNVRTRLVELSSALPSTLVGVAGSLMDNPGKCLRPHLLEVCSRFGRPSVDRVIKLGTLIELLHVATLLHDDVIDRAVLRRGSPTAHTTAGHEMAVLTGTACMALAVQEAADLGSGISEAVSLAAAELAFGELLDLERAFDSSLDTDAYLELANRKTAALFRLACVLGAGDANATPATILALATFGTKLGIAFQIADDCLDLRVGPADKSVGTDHLLGLFGLPTLWALRNGADQLRELLRSPDLSVADLPAIRDAVLAAGGVDAAMSVAMRCYRDAIAALGDLVNTEPGAVLVQTGEAVLHTWS